MVTTVPVGRWPEDVVFDPGSGHLFVADEGSAMITVLGANGEGIRTIRLTTRARHLAVDPGLGHLYAPNEGSAFVVAFETRILEEVAGLAWRELRTGNGQPMADLIAYLMSRLTGRSVGLQTESATEGKP
ncbi:MAG TPA: hypothetical protein VFF86_06295 [Candidatus Methylomirabilis sp.]|nr:hypothetical protein [Candidatus Methylomirabilis sp.]